MKLKTSVMSVATLVPVLLLVGLTVGWAVIEEDTTTQPTPETSTPATTVAPPPSPPPDDVRGKELVGLPRYPGSVRAGYERMERSGLVLTNARYLIAGEKPDAVRGFYRGVFTSRGWEEGDVEFSGGVWTFFVIHDEREATVEISPHPPNVVGIMIRLSEPGPARQATSEPGPNSRTPRQTIPEPAGPIPTGEVAPQYVPEAPAQQYPPTPQYATPAPAYGDDGGDDDGGGDD